MFSKIIQFLDRLFPPTLERVLASFETTKVRLEALAVRQVEEARALRARATDLRARAATIQESSQAALELATKADRIAERLASFTD
jgi:hypothetical protein